MGFVTPFPTWLQELRLDLSPTCSQGDAFVSGTDYTAKCCRVRWWDKESSQSTAFW